MTMGELGESLAENWHMPETSTCFFGTKPYPSGVSCLIFFHSWAWSLGAWWLLEARDLCWDLFQQNYLFGEIVFFLPIQFEPDVKACCFVEAGDLWWSLFEL